jgi:hypothetical protein
LILTMIIVTSKQINTMTKINPRMYIYYFVPTKKLYWY